MDINVDELMPPCHDDNKIDNTVLLETLLSLKDDIDSPFRHGQTPLHLAVVLENEGLVKLLLTKGADVNATDVNNVTPLHIAAELEKETIAELLLDNGADINAEDNECVTALNRAVGEHQLNTVKLLLIKGADPNKSNDKIQRRDFRPIDKYWKEDTLEPDEPDDGSSLTVLHLAASENLLEIVKLLIDYKADVNAKDAYDRTPLFYAIFTGNVEIVKLLLSKTTDVNKNSDLLKGAVYKNCKEMVEILLDAGVDVNSTDEKERTALHYIPMYREISFGHWMDDDCMTRNLDDEVRCQIARLLLSRGATVDAQDYHKKTALHAATENGFVDIVEVLLEFGADVNAVNQYKETPIYYSSDETITRMLLKKGAMVDHACEKGHTPLHKAATEGYHGIVKTLLEHNANVNAANNSGETPLHLFAATGDAAACEMLLERGAMVNAKTKDGTNALHDASTRNKVDVITLLLKYGADVDSYDTSRKTTALYDACKPECIEVFKILLDHNVDVNRMFEKTDFNRVETTFRTLLERIDGKHRYRHIRDVLIQHIVKLKALNLYVCDRNLKLIDLNGEWRAFYNDCKEEVERMKQREVSDNVSFYDVLTKSVDKIATYVAYASNARVFAATELKDYRQIFNIYYNMMDCKYEKVRARTLLVSRSMRTFNLLVRHRLPVIVTEMIMNHLSDEDMRNLIRIVTTYKPSTNTGSYQQFYRGLSQTPIKKRRNI